MAAHLDELIEKLRKNPVISKPEDARGLDDHDAYSLEYERMRPLISERLLIKSELEKRKEQKEK